MATFKLLLQVGLLLIFICGSGSNPTGVANPFTLKQKYPLDMSKLDTAATTVTVDPNTDFAECICNLTTEICDEYCCCDTDCTDAKRTEWENAKPDRCLKETSRRLNHDDLCEYSQDEYYPNSKAKKTNYKNLFEKILCIEWENLAEIGKYFQLMTTADLSSEEIDTKYNDATSFASNLSVANLSTSGSYQIGDLMDIRRNGQRVRFSLPGPNVAGFCDDFNTVKYLEDSYHTTCERSVDLTTQCATSPFSPTGYLNFEVAQTYGVTSQFTTITTGTINTINMATLEITSTAGNLPDSELNAGVCTNVLLEVSYEIILDAAGAPTTVRADVLLANSLTAANVTKINQRFSVEFLASSNEIKRSGNPGYINGLPLLIGQKNGNIVNVYSHGFELTGVNADGSCVAANTNTWNPWATTIGFNEKVVFGCTLSMAEAAYKNFCENAEFADYEIFDQIGFIETIGRFGTADQLRILDWVDVESVAAPTPTLDNLTCNNMPSVLEIEIWVAKAGAVSNPQTFVLRARKSYKTTTWKYIKSDSNSTQQFGLYVTVSFIHVEEEDLFNVDPTLDFIVARDVFYPLQLGNSFKETTDSTGSDKTANWVDNATTG